jgi:hypothetical protein|eukprot:gene11800-13760_t
MPGATLFAIQQLNVMKRVLIFPKDVIRITGFSLRKSQLLIQQIRSLLKKKPLQYLTVKEFAHFMGLDPNEIEIL